MFNFDQLRTQISRRYFFGQSATGLGAAALGSVLNPQLFGATPNANDGLGALPALHHAPKAK
ncbi:MAG TPA: sulfatase, partial [Planctomycetaceae bacterium]|nr:sulfatase [Planctomycetaceae bacterium]